MYIKTSQIGLQTALTKPRVAAKRAATGSKSTSHHHVAYHGSLLEIPNSVELLSKSWTLQFFPPKTGEMFIFTQKKLKAQHK